MKKTHSKASRTAGLLILFGMFAGLLSVVPAVEGTDYLQAVYPNQIRVMLGAFFQLLLFPCYIGFALVLYPMLRASNKAFALGFVGFRFLSGAFQLLGVILLPLFVLLSRHYITDVNVGQTPYDTIGQLLKLLRDLSNHLGVMVATGLGNLLLYVIFLKDKQLPRWLSCWGVLGNSLILIAALLLLFQWIEVISVAYGILSLPLVLQEVVLAIWLLTKRLKPPIKTPSTA